jgi:hypothetical protein
MRAVRGDVLMRDDSSTLDQRPTSRSAAATTQQRNSSQTSSPTARHHLLNPFRLAVTCPGLCHRFIRDVAKSRGTTLVGVPLLRTKHSSGTVYENRLFTSDKKYKIDSSKGRKCSRPAGRVLEKSENRRKCNTAGSKIKQFYRTETHILES